MAQNPIILYTAATPNGYKISILLEELGLKYDVKTLSFQKNEQKEDWFLKINPNGRIPAIEDRSTNPPTPVFESGAIMLYLTDKYDKQGKASYSRDKDPEKYYETIQWLFFQNAGVGPMQGQANHFFRYAPEKIQYGIDRYQNETRRLYKVLDKRIRENGGYLVGDHVTIADISNFGWVNSAAWAGVDIEEFPNLKKWYETLKARPGFEAGLDVPKKNVYRDVKDPKEMERVAKEASAWVLQGMEADKKK